jgi:hypothetical protein
VKRDGNGKVSDRGAERAKWVNEYRSSGLGLKQFARRRGLRPGQLHYWVYQTRQPSLAQVPLPTFREVRLAATTLPAGCWHTEIGLPNGTTVRLARKTDLAWTIGLLESLRGPCSRP